MRINDPSNRDAINKLIFRIARRDKQALHDLHQAMGDTLYSVLYALFDDEDLCKMTYMELLPKIWRDAPEFTPTLQDGTSWLIMVTRRLGIERVRRLNPERRLIANGIEVSDIVDQNLEKFGKAKSAAIIINRCIGHLPPLASDLVVASYIFGFKRDELAEIYGKTSSAISRTLSKAGNLLKICLRDIEHGT